MSFETDVVVVGGGPAGSAAAIWCSKHGLRVSLLEKVVFPRDRPGETLHPGIEPLLQRLGLEDHLRTRAFLRHAGIWIRWPQVSEFVPFGHDAYGQWLGLQAWRADLDSLLLERARATGVEIRQPCETTGLMKEGGRVVGVSSSLGQIRCRYVIDAAGGQHWLRHKLGLDLQRASPPLTAYYGYCEGTCPERDEAPAIEIEGSGWVWTARVEPGLYHWTRLSLGAPLSKPARAPSVFQHLAQKGKMRAADVTWRIMPHSAGCGYFIVGDAAAVVDPAASHGVLRALMSGMMAAHGILKVVKDGANEEQYASHYRTWLSEWFRRDVEELKTLYHELAPAAEWLTGTRASDRDSARVDVLGC